jgi:hypothetical protein
MTIPLALPDFTCTCGETYWLTGDTPADMLRAVAEWRGCACTPEPPEPDGLGEGRLAPGHIFAPAPRSKWLGFLLTAVAPCMALWLGGGYLAVHSIAQ